MHRGVKLRSRFIDLDEACRIFRALQGHVEKGHGRRETSWRSTQSLRGRPCRLPLTVPPGVTWLSRACACAFLSLLAALVIAFR